MDRDRLVGINGCGNVVGLRLGSKQQSPSLINEANAEAPKPAVH